MAKRRPVTEAKGTPTRARKRARKGATSPRASGKATSTAAKKRAEAREAARRARAVTQAQQHVFLEHYAATGVITAAARLADVDRKRHYEWIEDTEKYPDYRSRFDDAHEQAADRIEAEMVRRGVQGVERTVFGRLPGKDTGTGKVGTIREYSDQLLITLAKARRPERFRERYEHSGPDGGPIPAKFTIKIDGDHDA